MKKVLLLFVCFLLLAGTVSAQVKKGGTLYASAKSVALKSSTGFFAKTQGTLSYGEQVTVLQVNGKWVQVQSITGARASGWTASSNLTSKRITSVSSAGSASASEIALAGKGFSEEVENAYKAEGNLNYADVDKTEALSVSEDDLYSFLIEGHLFTGDK
ncbi:MAG: SH3 domain-containing protein [Treponema sp.]|nr:SH3 domain-containing protein [Treponema sp.]